MITPDLMREAITSMSVNCEGEEGCPHNDALIANAKILDSVIGAAIAHALTEHKSPSILIFSEGVHIGYRLHQLETSTPTVPTTIN